LPSRPYAGADSKIETPRSKSDGRIVIKSRRARPFFARHPWVFDTSIDRVEGNPEPGDEVTVVSSGQKLIGRGLYNPESTIRVRLYRWDDGPLDETFWSHRLGSALRLRRDILHCDGQGSACRLVFSEGDGLSGLTVDRYDRWLVAQFTSLALYRRRELLLRLLGEQTGVEGIIARTERGIAMREGLRAGEEMIVGSVPDGPVEIVENGLRYQADLRSGQKTGFYLDQRDNRRAVAGYCRGKRVLDLFCFTGAFALGAVKDGDAAEALGIDSSAPAIERARVHAAINGVERVRFETGDVLKVLERLRSEGQQFDVVICDPPKYAPQAKDVEHALKAYLRLNLAALDVLAPDGVLATCSCSGSVGRELFVDLIGQVAEQSGRPIQILEQRGQAPDHPISASCLETEYLKCFICRVE
jgi:23S rRNA (cytosine1962-C5)-methyltransferase